MPAGPEQLAALTVANFFAFVFIGAAVHKLADRVGFTALLDAYDLTPTSFSRVLTAGVAAAELACGALLLWPSAAGLGAGVGVLLLLVYAGAMAANLLRGRPEIRCGCGGAGQRIGWSLVARNFAYAIALAAASALAPSEVAPSTAAAAFAAALLARAGLGAAEQAVTNRAAAARLGLAGRPVA